jgi:hypothetical protein
MIAAFKLLFAEKRNKRFPGNPVVRTFDCGKRIRLRDIFDSLYNRLEQLRSQRKELTSKQGIFFRDEDLDNAIEAIDKEIERTQGVLDRWPQSEKKNCRKNGPPLPQFSRLCDFGRLRDRNSFTKRRANNKQEIEISRQIHTLASTLLWLGTTLRSERRSAKRNAGKSRTRHLS